MWLWFVAVACAALLPADPTSANSGLSSSTFSSNEWRTGFSKLYQNGLDQPFTTPFTLFNPDEYLSSPDPVLQQFRRPAPFGPQLAPTFRYPSHPRFRPGGGGGGGGRGGGGRKPNDVLVIVVKANKNCTNSTEPSGGGDDDDDDDNDGDENEGELNPDDEVETVTVVSGGSEKNKEPSRCVWAILSCCAPSNSNIRYTCFDILGCSTAFWNTNPCVPAIIKTVLEEALKYYGGGGNSNNGTTTTAAPTTTTTAAPAPDGLAALSTDIVAAAAATPLDVKVTPAPLASDAAATAT